MYMVPVPVWRYHARPGIKNLRWDSEQELLVTVTYFEGMPPFCILDGCAEEKCEVENYILDQYSV